MNTESKREGFTFIELIVVMAMLTIVLALSVPSLSPFFKGRTLDEEARRFLTLTRYGHSEAISRGVPMELWVNVNTGEYGLLPRAGYQFENMKPVEFILSENLHFEVTDSVNTAEDAVLITFLPDGSLQENSVRLLRIRNDNNEWLSIEKPDFGFEYVIRDDDDQEAQKSHL